MCVGVCVCVSHFPSTCFLIQLISPHGEQVTATELAALKHTLEENTVELQKSQQLLKVSLSLSLSLSLSG
eukprot:COSAG03_NODE_2292_length_2911_cov_1.899360_1_plen_70_part_00